MFIYNCNWIIWIIMSHTRLYVWHIEACTCTTLIHRHKLLCVITSPWLKKSMNLHTSLIIDPQDWVNVFSITAIDH